MAPAGDFSSDTWIAAFGQLHERRSAEYAFSDWKDINWRALGSACRTEIQATQDQGDFEAYHLALRRYVNAIPDGHMNTASIPEIDQKHVGGGFGFSHVMLADGRVIATWVDDTPEVCPPGCTPGTNCCSGTVCPS